MSHLALLQRLRIGTDAVAVFCMLRVTTTMHLSAPRPVLETVHHCAACLVEKEGSALSAYGRVRVEGLPVAHAGTADTARGLLPNERAELVRQDTGMQC